MKKTWTMSALGALAAGTAMVAAPGAAQAQGLFGLLFGPPAYQPVSGYYLTTPAAGMANGYAYPDLRFGPAGGVVRTRVVASNPTTRVIVGPAPYGYGVAPGYYAAPVTSRRVLATGAIATAPYYGPYGNEYARPELRSTGRRVVRTRIIQRNPTVRAVVDERGRVIRTY